MPITGVAKKAGAAFAPKRRRAVVREFSSDDPPPMTAEQARRSREFAEKAHRAIIAQGYTEADLTRIIKEVRAESRGAKS